MCLDLSELAGRMAAMPARIDRILHLGTTTSNMSGEVLSLLLDDWSPVLDALVGGTVFSDIDRADTTLEAKARVLTDLLRGNGIDGWIVEVSWLVEVPTTLALDCVSWDARVCYGSTFEEALLSGLDWAELTQ